MRRTNYDPETHKEYDEQCRQVHTLRAERRHPIHGRNTVPVEKLQEVLNNASEIQQLYEAKVNYLVSKQKEITTSHDASIDSLKTEHQKYVDMYNEQQEINKKLIEALESKVQSNTTNAQIDTLTKKLDLIEAAEKKGDLQPKKGDLSNPKKEEQEKGDLSNPKKGDLQPKKEKGEKTKEKTVWDRLHNADVKYNQKERRPPHTKKP